jgi:outer membrane protein
MKKELVILLLLLFIIRGEISAQQKYGHINSNEIVQMMPEFKEMSAAVEKRKKDAQLKVQQMYDSYQQKVQELNKLGPSMMEAVRREKTIEVDSLQKNIQNFEQKASSEIQEFQDKLLKPLNDKYLKVVSAVAKENGYTYIFDLGTGSVVYHPESTGDISDLVKKKLGIN